jgi:hypothetical protein
VPRVDLREVAAVLVGQRSSPHSVSRSKCSQRVEPACDGGARNRSGPRSVFVRV